jgi:hypothetical protein
MSPLQKFSLDQSSAIECIHATLANEVEPLALDQARMRRKGVVFWRGLAERFPWRKVICERGRERLHVEALIFKRLVIS